LTRLVKRPICEVCEDDEATDHASVRTEGFLVAGVERWKEYVAALKPAFNGKPILFVMLTEHG
jgi:hypothetical protein